MARDLVDAIDVLLATYRPNGKMLQEQIDSIYAQQGVEIDLIRREDVDGVGACSNFASLLQMSSAKYVAFSDQDDVWLVDKLSKSLARMHELESQYGSNIPLLVFSDAHVVDANLHLLDKSLFSRTKIDPTRIKPQQLILQNVANGNTMLINDALRKKVLPIPSKAVMHDHWVMLVASVYGKIASIGNATLLYRQHGGNVFGGARVGVRYYIKRILQGRAKLKERIYRNLLQAEAFALRYPDAPDCFKACVAFEKKNWFVRRWLLLQHGILKNGFIRNLGTFLFV